jgi:hypothetical protein
MPDFYQYDPADGLWHQQGIEGDNAVAIDQLTHGRYSVVDGAVWDRYSSDPQKARLDATERHVLTVDEQGNWWLNSFTHASQINTMPPGHIQWKGVARGSVRLPTGHTVSLDEQIFSVTKFNRQLWVKDVPNPKRSDYIHVDVDRVTGQPKATERIPRNFRPATAEEAMTFGVAGLLAARHAGAIQALVDRAKQAKQ